MKFCHYISTLLSVMLSFSALAEESPIRGHGRIVPFKYGPAITPDNQATLLPIYPRVYRDLFHCKPVFRLTGKVDEMVWVNTADLTPLEIKEGNAEALFYSETDLLLKTTGYQQGDCLEVVMEVDDGGDIYEGQKILTVYAMVNAHGIVHFRQPFKEYTLNIR
ncbi:hypothetical protein KGP17_13225 [Serratia sp. JSRIV001]|uniref:Uncharacterized protein n=1 Tax=Serratia fonticola TaxID=47917 RepID=A0AAP2FCF1_SERFO|nr:MULTISPECIES: hypothetical protein [Serratia]MBC3214535.1 hypothetical protein [Serratia fonticola]MBP1034482.1 hypothetical protein [Serratia fonticola]NYA11342.1 hypothetical protein [Serratia fonticola]NYA31246.1 hypothetical protein [Serratia fonticola]NYA41960.1 hypothetical protein [Serratia fonticola]